jgi:hypothetical protein
MLKILKTPVKNTSKPEASDCVLTLITLLASQIGFHHARGHKDQPPPSIGTQVVELHACMASTLEELKPHRGFTALHSSITLAPSEAMKTIVVHNASVVDVQHTAIVRADAESVAA